MFSLFWMPVRMQSIFWLLVCIWALMPFSTAFLDFSACVFPFIYKNKTYPTCTRADSQIDMLWCATTANYDKDHKWKKCYKISKTHHHQLLTMQKKRVLKTSGFFGLC
ncbi:hypothetical protein lerEdw1_006538 [Lerista edwardsae]|nr:hypothetical protein lerEdw1_006538 [Lerista edwardsae]